ncbi:trimethylguanosine synthase-like [Punica granatum]|uniref:Trimethylguanosine synthase n=1 Tax=Punica granatum TaxID=22663 RepID=A0A6P8C1I2_PUNGR|nr:trimethylguanosine synthase-like [Punica granatum]
MLSEQMKSIRSFDLKKSAESSLTESYAARRPLPAANWRTTTEEDEEKQQQAVQAGLGAHHLKKKRKRVNLKRGRVGERQEVTVSPLVEKYWFQRYKLFSRYDVGIRMDEEGWYSVTPEEIAIRHAEKCRGRTVIDCFAGVGGNAIQFARMCYYVVAIDIDPQKVALALHNAKIYGVEDCIDFISGDFFQLAPSLKADIVYISPPWGGPSYKNIQNFTLDLLKPKDGYSLFQVAQVITPNIIMFLPRNIDLNQVEELSWLSSPPLEIEIEKNYVDGNFKGITVYFGRFESDVSGLPSSLEDGSVSKG